MKNLASGRWNLAAGLSGITLFMVYGFVLIYMRDVAPGHEEWAANYGIGTHFEARLAHVHGALFSVLNVLMGAVIPQLQVASKSRAGIAGLTLVGLLMPVGIVAEFILGAPPVLVLVGALSIMTAFGWASVAALVGPAKV